MGEALRVVSEGWRDFLGFAGFDYLCELDGEARYLEVSPNYFDLLRLNREQILGKTPFELGILHPDDLESIHAALVPLFEDNQQVRFEYRVRTYQGEWRWMESTSHPFLTPAGAWRVLFISRDITERREVEQAFERESALLRDIIEFNPMSMQILDMGGYTLKVNAAHTRLFQAVPPPDYTLFRDPLLLGQGLGDLLQRIQEGQVVVFPEFYHNPHAIYPEFPDTPVWIRMVAFPIAGKDGQPERFVLMHEDITARHTAELALRKESALLRDIIDHNPMSIQLLDLEGRTTSVNEAHTRLFHARPPAEYSVFTDPLVERQGLQNLWERLRQGQVVFFPEFHYNVHDVFPELPDVPVWLRMVGFPISGPDGKPERFVLMHEDVTERRRAEESLRESEDRFRGLYLNTTDAIFWVGVDRDGGFHYEGSNPAHDALTGLTNDALLGKRPEDCLEPVHAARVMDHYRRCLTGGEPTSYEDTLESSEGVRHLQTLLVPIRDREGRIYRLVGTSRDITQIKQTEEVLRQAQKLESLGVLAGGIAHDFNNLLTAILGNLNLAQLKLSPEAPAQPHLEAVERTVLKASELTRQMLAYSGKGHFVVRSHDLNEVVQEMAHLLQVSISKKVMLRLKLAPGLPCVDADVAQIQQVIMNLVTNASDAIGDQEGVISIGTHVKDLNEYYIARTFSTQELAPGRYVILDVSDTGCGISPEVMERIFDPFFTTKASGRGLGLSAMLGILRGHGGGFKIYSELGRGTTFKIYLPAGSAIAHRSPEASGVDILTLRGKVLVVDDEPTIRESLQHALESFGMSVVLASDGQEALDLFSREPDFDLVLMDLTMPRLDGREAFLAMREIRPEVRVILSSGYSEQESVQELLGKDLAGFIQKPYQLRDLKKVISRALGKG